MKGSTDPSTLLAVRRALTERQLAALRSWLGDDHELLRRGETRATPAAQQPAGSVRDRPQATAGATGEREAA